MKTLKVLGFLLTYPSAQTIEVLDECREILAKEKWLDDAAVSGVNSLMEWLEKTDLLDAQEEYVALFDRTPSLSLHLFEHVHGDSKDRGQAMVDLSDVYREIGLEINTKELPDFLPLFLEYLSIIDVEEARNNLGDVVDITSIVGERLKKRGSVYSNIFDALAVVASCSPNQEIIAEAIKKSSGSPVTFDKMDEEWEEQNAFENSMQTTGQDADGGCPIAEDMLARMNIPNDKVNSKEEA